MSDQPHQLDHDHSESLRYLTEVLSGLLEGAQTGREATRLHAEFAEVLDEMCREVEHFAMEEGELFPLLRAASPELGGRIDEVEASHRALDGQVARLASLVGRGPAEFASSIGEVTGLVSEFIREYARHTEHERELFAAAERELSPERKKALLAAIEKR